MKDQEKLRKILANLVRENGHEAVPEDHVPAGKNSYFTELRTYHNDDGRKLMDVRCVCGKEMTLPYRVVNQGYKTSCGCKDENLEKRINTFREYVQRLPRRMEDLRTSGLHGDGVHGFLKVVDFHKPDERLYWVLECVCGTKILKTRRQMVHMKYDTCGQHQCLRLRRQGYTREQALKMFSYARKADRDPSLVTLVQLTSGNSPLQKKKY